MSIIPDEYKTTAILALIAAAFFITVFLGKMKDRKK
jgi:hypothetical protein